MKHENSHPGATKGQHVYKEVPDGFGGKTRAYVEDEDFEPSEYPKWVNGKVVKDKAAEDKELGKSEPEKA